MVDLEASTVLIFDYAISPIENPWTDDFPIKKWKF
jgi:CBS-domain-containing membrane protein